MQPDKELADWLRVECERLTFAASELLRLAGRAWAASAVIEIVREAPRGPEVQADTNMLLVRLFAEARERGGGHGLARAADYFIALASEPPARRALLEAAVVGALVGSGMGR